MSDLNTRGSAPTSEDRLAAALEEVCTAMEDGQPLDRVALINKYPDIRDEIVGCLDNLNFINQVAPQLTDEQGSTPSVMPLATLGDFRIVREIGRGGMGVVYEAEQLWLGRTVALKVLPFAAMLDARQLERFKNESRAAATLNHPHIVPIYSVGSDRSVHYYAMQMVEGQSLAEVIIDLRQLAGKDTSAAAHSISEATSKLASGTLGSSFKPDGSEAASSERQRAEPSNQATRDPIKTHAQTTRVTPQAALSTERFTSRSQFYRGVASLGVQAAQALNHAHDRGVLHRDVKPGNLLLDDSGKLWITDFGLALVETESRMTATGDLLGTLRYMAPEVALANRVVVDQRADIYALGATLYELLTLQPVFAGSNRQELLKRIAFEEPRAPRRIDRAIPFELETIILKAIEKNPDDRYQTAVDFADDLNRFLEHKPIKALRAGPIRHVLKWSRRHRAVVASVILTLSISLCIGIIFLARAYRTERQQRHIAQQQTQRAEARLQLALEAVDDMYVNIATEWIADETSISEMQSSFLKRALRTYRQLAAELADDPSQREVFAETCERIGQIHEYLNEHQDAADALRKSIEASEQLVVDEPESREHRSRLVTRHGLLAVSLEAVSDHQHADRALANVKRHLQELTERHPDEDGYQRQWGKYYLQRASLQLSQEQLQQAEQLATKAEGIFKTIYPLSYPENSNPNDLDACLLLLKSNGCLAEILQRQGRLKEARARCEGCLRFTNRWPRNQFHDSQSFSMLTADLETLLAEILRSEGRLTAAEEQLRRSLETQRRALKSGYDPVLFFVKSFGPEILDKGFEQELFCNYVETQLRLSEVLLALGRPYETERVLGECMRTSQMLCDTSPNILRCRIARANSWARTGQLLAQDRPEESRLAWEYATAIWHDTLMRFSHAGEYRSGIHPSTDYEWYRANLPGSRESAADAPFVYAQFDDPLRETVFQQHALGLAWYRGGAWKSAIHHFGKAAELRKSDHAFDWLYIAMAYRRLGEAEQAREWYDKATAAIRESEPDNMELTRLREYARELMSEDSTPPTKTAIDSSDPFQLPFEVSPDATASFNVAEPEVLLGHEQQTNFPGIQAISVHASGDANSNPRFGRVVAAATIGSGERKSFALWRFQSDGFEGDATFGDDGIAKTAVNGTLWGAGMDSSERVVVAGIGSHGELILARFLPDGLLDRGFGDGGRLTTDDQVFDENNLSVACDKTGDVYIAGVFGGRGGSYRVIRFSSKGVMDKHFGDNGIRTIKVVGGVEFNGQRLNSLPASIAVQNDGKVLIAGTVGDPNNRYAGLIRMNPDGALDDTWDGDPDMPTPYPGNGIVTTNIPYRHAANHRNYASGIVADKHGRILTTGTSSHGMVIVRYNADGSLDKTFNASGRISGIPGIAVATSQEQFISGHTRGRQLTLDSAGRIVVGGLYQHGLPQNSFGWPVVAQNPDFDHFVFARFEADGTPDTTFGADGVLEKRVGSGWNNLSSLVVAPSGDIWAAGIARARAPDAEKDELQRDPFGRRPFVAAILRLPMPTSGVQRDNISTLHESPISTSQGLNR